MLKKIWYIISQQYNPYFLYWYDLLTERHLKNRTGQCIDCFECCKYVGGGHCCHINLETKRCNVYNNRKCDQWFPISQKELDYMANIKPGFKCKFSFNNNGK